MIRISISHSEFEATVEWKYTDDNLKCGSKARASGLKIEINKTDESSVGMQLILDTDRN